MMRCPGCGQMDKIKKKTLRDHVGKFTFLLQALISALETLEQFLDNFH
jgi:hypothetical protein